MNYPLVVSNKNRREQAATLGQIFVANIFGLASICVVVFSFSLGQVEWVWFAGVILFSSLLLLGVTISAKHAEKVEIIIDEKGITIVRDARVTQYVWPDISGTRFSLIRKYNYGGPIYRLQIVRTGDLMKGESDLDLIPSVDIETRALISIIDDGVNRWGLPKHSTDFPKFS